MSNGLLGTDVSHWQGNIDFTVMKSAGARYVFIKSSQAAWTDVRFVRNWQAAKDAGLPRGAYHFIDWTRTAVQQADHFSNVLTAHGLGELPPVADFELRAGAPPQAQSALFLRTFCERVRTNTGKRPIVYTAPYYWREQGSTDAYWAQYDLWLANYRTGAPVFIPAPWKDWTFWQYTDKGPGSAFGVSSAAIDLNLFNGTQAQFDAKFGLGAPELPPMPEPPGGFDWMKWADDIEQRVKRLENIAGFGK